MRLMTAKLTLLTLFINVFVFKLLVDFSRMCFAEMKSSQ